MFASLFVQKISPLRKNRPEPIYILSLDIISRRFILPL